jgi:hypothetical protein
MRYLVNNRQTTFERSEKYEICRAAGINACLARRMRDWRWSKLNRFFEANHYDTRTFETRKHYLKAKAQEEELELCSQN